MEKMKKSAVLLLTLSMSFSLGIVCEGSGAPAADTNNSTKKFEGSGITLNLPPEFQETHGVIVPNGGFDLTDGDGIYETSLLYFALDQEEYDNYSANPNPSEEEIDKFQNSCTYLVTILSADNGLTFDDINELAGDSLNPSAAQVICTVEGCTHYLYDFNLSLPEDTDTVFLEEFEALKGCTDKLLAGSEFGKPKDLMADMIGRKIQFVTTDTDGNPVKSEELFASHEITMLNIWASWCGFCVDEMEELEAINGRLTEKDCAVVGLLSDGNEEVSLASGKEILKDKGVTYINLLPPDHFDEIFYLEGYPTTFFINRKGVIVGTPIVGARIDQYEPAIETLLTETESTDETLLNEAGGDETKDSQFAAHVEANDDSLYRVIVNNEEGTPIPGVMVQFCSDIACMMGETDETGTAVFQEPQGEYTVHILKAPEEYTVDETEYPLEEFADLTICLYRK